AGFPVGELRRLLPSAETVALAYNDRLFARGATARHVFFPQHGIIALVHRLADGATVQVAAIGDAGAAGIAGVVGDTTYRLDGIVQNAGTALRLDAGELHDAIRRSPRLAAIMMQDLARRCLETAQNIACNAHHSIEQRLARWLVAAHDGAGRDALTVSHAFLSMMLGTQRTGITAALGALKQARLVDTRYGGVTVRDRKRLAAVACPCYRTVRRLYAGVAADRPHR
ncbi:MAG TPA: Crp/Fnr family transcriptional regulator, partial [Stellaceae bacterium]|nr:Crp/Fnr family transcriptional regulator [Stellaceae bacterium]